MKKSRFTDSQIMAVFKRSEGGEGVPDLCREIGISTATFYKWRAKFGGMDVSMMARTKELEDENRRLKKIYMDDRLEFRLVPLACHVTHRIPSLDQTGIAYHPARMFRTISLRHGSDNSAS